MNNTYAGNLLTLASIYLITCVLPGPDFVNVTSHALSTRKSGMLVAAGVMLGCSVWSTVAVFGLGMVTSMAFPYLKILRGAGALYLTYRGLRTVYVAFRPRPTQLQIAPVEHNDWSSFRCGFITDIANPTLMVFFGGLFATALPTNSPLWVRYASIFIIVFIAGAWHLSLAILFSMKTTRDLYQNMKRPTDLLLGTILVGLGVRLAVT